MSLMKLLETFGLFADDLNSENSNAQQKIVPTLTAEQPDNPFTEIQVLAVHTDIVRLLIAANNSKIVSASDDATAIVWDFLTGQWLHILIGHTRPITHMLFIPISDGKFSGINTLVTCSSDKSIRIWDLDLGSCLKTIISDKMNSLKVLIEMRDLKMVCSAGQEIKFWSMDFEEVCSCERLNEDVVSAVIQMNKIYLVCAVGSQIVIYKAHSIDGSNWSLEILCHLERHLETISSLAVIKSSLFCSGSLDGNIIVWSTDTWSCIHRFCNGQQFHQLSMDQCSFSIQHIFTIDNKYLLAACGTGFIIYDSQRGCILTSRKNAHHSKVLHLEVVCSGSLIATCSEDGAIKLWGFYATDFSDSHPHSPRSFFVPISEVCKRWGDSGTKRSMPELVGECLGHGGIVYKLLPFDLGMCSCGADGSIILWKDGEQQWRWRNKLVQEMIHSVGLKQ